MHASSHLKHLAALSSQTDPSGLFHLSEPRFDTASGVDLIYKDLKPTDSLALSFLLSNTPLIQRLNTERVTQQKVNHKPTVNTLATGCGGGIFLTMVLQKLDLSTNVSIVERNEKRVKDFEENAQKYPEYFHGIKAKYPDMNDLPAFNNQFDIILNSHTVYYNPSQWSTCKSIHNHYFTQLFKALKEDGVLCFTIQSADPELKGAHETLENLLYPIHSNCAHGDNTHYANAEQFKVALGHYSKRFAWETGKIPGYTIRSYTSNAKIRLDDLNTTPDEDGFYFQPNPLTREKLGFYLRGKAFKSLSAENQKKVIDALQKYFKDSEGNFTINHYNTTFVLQKTSELSRQLDKLDRLDRLDRLDNIKSITAD